MHRHDGAGDGNGKGKGKVEKLKEAVTGSKP